MNQVLNINNNVTNTNSNFGSGASSKPSLKACLKSNFDLDNADKTDLISRVSATKADKFQISKKKNRKTTKLMQLSKITFLMKCLSIFILANVKDIIFWPGVIIWLMHKVVTTLKLQKFCFSLLTTNQAINFKSQSLYNRNY